MGYGPPFFRVKHNCAITAYYLSIYLSYTENMIHLFISGCRGDGGPCGPPGQVLICVNETEARNTVSLKFRLAQLEKSLPRLSGRSCFRFIVGASCPSRAVPSGDARLRTPASPTIRCQALLSKHPSQKCFVPSRRTVSMNGSLPSSQP